MTGVLMGSMVLISANTILKRLVRLALLSCDPEREQNLCRLGNWALMLGGLG